jgi:hypothetical protein
MAKKKVVKSWTEEELRRLEVAACTPATVRREKLNPNATIPYGCTPDHIYQAVVDFTQFLAVVNQALHSKRHERLEATLMPANFSGVVSDFLVSAVPKYCKGLAKNGYHNGHPDLLPAGRYPDDCVQYADEGIEVKASRRGSGWQGHNAEKNWLLVFCFDCNGQRDARHQIEPRPFRFTGVYLAQLTLEDWAFSGRRGASRRTPTASVNKSGVHKLKQNWVYHDSGIDQGEDLYEVLKSTDEEGSEKAWNFLPRIS